MATYIGNNDPATLEGVAEVLRRSANEYRRHPANKRPATLRRLEAVASALEREADFFLQCAGRGPTPTPAQLADLKIVIPETSRLRLQIDNEMLGLESPLRPIQYAQADDEWRYQLGDDGWSPWYPTELAMLEVALAHVQDACGGDPERAGHAHGTHNEQPSDVCGVCDPSLLDDADPMGDAAREIGYTMLGIPKGDPRRGS